MWDILFCILMQIAKKGEKLIVLGDNQLLLNIGFEFLVSSLIYFGFCFLFFFLFIFVRSSSFYIQKFNYYYFGFLYVFFYMFFFWFLFEDIVFSLWEIFNYSWIQNKKIVGLLDDVLQFENLFIILYGEFEEVLVFFFILFFFFYNFFFKKKWVKYLKFFFFFFLFSVFFFIGGESPINNFFLLLFFFLFFEIFVWSFYFFENVKYKK